MVDILRELRIPVLLAVGTCTAAPFAGATEPIRLFERATNEHVVDLGAHGDSPGDLLAFANPLYETANSNTLGKSNGSCVGTVVGGFWQCARPLSIAAGQVQVAGEYPDVGVADFAITGGTGRYAGARGRLRVHARHAGHTTYDFTVSLL